MDSKDTRPDSHRVTDQPWSFHGPYRVPKMDLFQAVFTISTLYTNHVGTLSWSLRNSTKAQGTLLDPIDPPMDPVRLISGDPW